MSDDYLRLAVHYSACNEFFFKTQDCEKEYPVSRAFGQCTQYYVELQKCIRRQRRLQQEANRKISEEKRERLKRLIAEAKAKENKA
ncbi:hypothetical protein KQX54_014540 [Cotesia glomerata]|uniref:COX assembly mitochondrial protein n=1 Tax=Cotesia glomerata TaxID=32391 RepID=A0AAV7IYA4_COTGL|nr:hypothetical protein KQX54_014540 [Cotesia glomerata]